jgi:hypothetical protein
MPFDEPSEMTFENPDTWGKAVAKAVIDNGLLAYMRRIPVANIPEQLEEISDWVFSDMLETVSLDDPELTDDDIVELTLQGYLLRGDKILVMSIEDMGKSGEAWVKSFSRELTKVMHQAYIQLKESAEQSEGGSAKVIPLFLRRK